MITARPEWWPVFQLVRIDVGPRVPTSAARILRSAGVPKGLIGHEYRAMEQAVSLPGKVGSGGGLVAFGTRGGGFGWMCLDVDSGAVVDVGVDVPGVQPATRHAVNANLELFSASARAVIERFPFYGTEQPPEDFERVGSDLRRALSEIDGSALSHNGFWETFLDDLVIGDYATEVVARADDHA